MLTISNSFVLISKSVNEKILDTFIHILDNCIVVKESIKFPSLAQAGNYDVKDKIKVVGIGGGTIIDTVKLIGRIHNLPVMVVPTVPGTGAEVTSFAVSYSDDGKKESLSTSIPDSVLIPEMAMSAPDKVLLSSYFDTFAQCVESAWSKGSTALSLEFAYEGLKLILGAYQLIEKDRMRSLYNAYEAAHLSGMAINISKTTAPHAMSYYLTYKHGLSHGQAVAASFFIWYKLCSEYLPDHFGDLLSDNLVFNLVMSTVPKDIYEKVDVNEWIDSVNEERMSNSPVQLDKDKLKDLFKISYRHDSSHIPFRPRVS